MEFARIYGPHVGIRMSFHQFMGHADRQGYVWRILLGTSGSAGHCLPWSELLFWLWETSLLGQCLIEEAQSLKRSKMSIYEVVYFTKVLHNKHPSSVELSFLDSISIK